MKKILFAAALFVLLGCDKASTATTTTTTTGVAFPSRPTRVWVQIDTTYVAIDSSHVTYFYSPPPLDACRTESSAQGHIVLLAESDSLAIRIDLFACSYDDGYPYAIDGIYHSTNNGDYFGKVRLYSDRVAGRTTNAIGEYTLRFDSLAAQKAGTFSGIAYDVRMQTGHKITGGFH